MQGSLAAVTGSALDPDLKLKKNYVRKTESNGAKATDSNT